MLNLFPTKARPTAAAVLLAAACSCGDSGHAGTLSDAGTHAPTDTTNSGTHGGADSGVTSPSGGGSASDGGSQGGTSTSSPAKAAAAKLGKSNFLIGMGNDLAPDHNQDGAYTLGVTLDLHYAYLVGLMGEGGWTDWNPNGSFVNMLTDTAKQHGVVPMFTLYAMAAHGEGNSAALVDDDYMKKYWDGAKLLFQRLADFNGPAVVQFEPDFWGYVQQASGGDPTKLPVHVKALAPDCSDKSDDLVGLGHCLVALARKYAPKTLVGFHASGWADSDPAKIAQFLVAVGAGEADLVTTDTLDRDAGCFEAHTDPGCQRNDGPWYWDETNQTSPNFHEHLAWVKKITTGIGKPMLWWQTPFGVASDTPGGTSGHYRDNRVKYIFSHIDEFIAAGGMGAVFGGGAGNQTYIDSDGGQFKNAVNKYFAAPVPLP